MEKPTHKYNSDNYASIGKASEDKFINLINSKYPTMKAYESSIDDNIRKHTDVYLTYNNNTYSVDVKNRKHNKLFIELECGGRPGWLYSKVDYFAFDITDKNQMIIIKGDILRKLINNSNYTICGRIEYNEKLVVLPYEELLKQGKIL